MKYWTGAVMAMAIALGAQAEDLPTLKGATLEIGTVNWGLNTIKSNEFDHENGFDLTLQPFADNGATRIALEGDEADFAVADWIWVNAQNAAGRDYMFYPYSRAVGGVVVPEDSDVQSLADLAGKEIGIAGGPVDKSWIILRAYAQQEYGVDLATQSDQVFGAPPLIMKAGLSGETDASINFWHFLAKMKAGGQREVISVADAATALGLDPNTPLLGYVFKRSFVEENPELVQGFIKSSRQMQDLLASNDGAWDAIRDQMNAKSDAQFEALKAGYRAGIPDRTPLNTEAMAKMFEVMRHNGGEKLVGEATALDETMFITADE